MSLKETILRTSIGLGLSDELLRLYDAATGRFEFEVEVDPAIRDYEFDPGRSEGKVLFLQVHGQTRVNYRLCILAHAFRTRGYEPVTVLCDGELPVCHRKALKPRESFGERETIECTLCNFAGRRLLEEFGLGHTTMTDELPDDYRSPPPPTEDIESFTYRGIELSPIAASSTRKCLKKYSLDLSDDHERDVYRQFLGSAMILTDLYEAVFSAADFDATVVHEPLYLHGGVALGVARKHGVNGYSQAFANREGHLLVGSVTNASPLGHFTDREFLREELKRPLDEAQLEAVEAVMQARTEAEELRFQHSPRTRKAIDTDSETTVGLFSNLLWDATVNADGQLFDDPFDWIESTIDVVDGADDVELVIKPHPAESIRGTNESVADWIEKRYDPLPSNVTLLQPDTDVDTYELLEQLDAGIVYNSTVGLEMAYRGKPVVVASECYYRALGFTVDPESRSEYRAVLRDIGDLHMAEEQHELARRYAYFLYHRKHIEFPFYRYGSDVELLPARHEDIEPGNENIDLIVERIVAGEPVVKPA